MSDADDERQDHGARQQHEPAGRDARCPTRVEHALQDLRHAEAGDETDGRAEQPITNASTQQGELDLTFAGADGAQQRVLPLALGDDDRERVVDDERPDEEGDEGEHEQQGVEETQRLLHLVARTPPRSLAGQHLGAVGHAVRDPRTANALGSTDPSPRTLMLSS